MARVRSDWQYRASFVLFTVSQFLVTFLDFLAIAIIFANVPELAGWSVAEVAFLYGLAGVSFSLSDAFVSQVERLSFHIKQGTFDRYLIRPVGPLVQLSADEFAFRRFGKVAQSAIVLVGAMAAVDVSWGPARLAGLAVALVAGTVIYSALWVVTSSVSFWLVDTQEFANAFTYGGNYLSQYPLDVYARWLRRLALAVVPVAFTAYVPSLWLLDRSDTLGLPAWLPFASPAVAALLLVPARLVWRAGLRHYRSTGS